MSIRHQNRWLLANVSAQTLFWAGMTLLQAYLLQQALGIRVAQVVLFGALARVAGKRLQWLYFTTIIVSITLFHVIVPSGAVIATIGAFRLTEGALRTGVYKALTIVGMVFISLVAVRADLRLPGTLGSLAARIFWSFEQIMERRGDIQLRRPFASVDALLFSLHDDLTRMDGGAVPTAERKGTARRSSPAGLALVVAIVAIQWGALLV